MKLIDQHMHTNFSFDSTEALENYLLLTDNILVTTEHLDFSEPMGNFIDRVPDYDRYLKQIQQLNQRYGNHVFPGIEIGWTKKDSPRIFDYLKDKKYAIKLFSIHQNGKADYMQKEQFTAYSTEELITEYLGFMREGIEEMAGEVDVLAHFDYGFRVHDITAEDLEKYAKEDLIDVFNFIIEHGIAFELNTSSMYKHQNLSLYHWAIKYYLELGGKLFTLASDAHRSADYQRNFADAVAFLGEYGVSEIIDYVNGGVMVKLAN